MPTPDYQVLITLPTPPTPPNAATSTSAPSFSSTPTLSSRKPSSSSPVSFSQVSATCSRSFSGRSSSVLSAWAAQWGVSSTSSSWTTITARKEFILPLSCPFWCLEAVICCVIILIAGLDGLARMNIRGGFIRGIR
ncbi:hypothetical protein EX30DRAFT_350292 [Ascodesmis nigricans]|uniref:Uncharacterized protein n=1 Tax=Ascodesmis nigricans TaxID=341454 RepID=A0A4S2MQ56_9PEZI|nr:hypothetical protein EX30DRAFT_350292 [Ascodesmis nigricans]